MSDESDHAIEQAELTAWDAAKREIEELGMWQVTDEMCEVALEAEARDRIQGFSYTNRHVIRDVWLPPDLQEIWSLPVGGYAEHKVFKRQCRIERMRKVLEAALALSSQQGNCK